MQAIETDSDFLIHGESQVEKEMISQFLEAALELLKNYGDDFNGYIHHHIAIEGDTWERALAVSKFRASYKPPTEFYEKLIARFERELLRIYSLQKKTEFIADEEKRLRLSKIERRAWEFAIRTYFDVLGAVESQLAAVKTPSDTIVEHAKYAEKCFHIIAERLPNNTDAVLSSSPDGQKAWWSKMVGIVNWFQENRVAPSDYRGPRDAEADFMELGAGIEIVRAFYNIPKVMDVKLYYRGRPKVTKELIAEAEREQNRVLQFNPMGGETLPVFDIRQILPAWRSACSLLGQTMPKISVQKTGEPGVALQSAFEAATTSVPLLLPGRVKAPEALPNTTRKTTSVKKPKKKRSINFAAVDCCRRYKTDKGRTPMKTIVEDYIEERKERGEKCGTFNSIMRVLNDNPEQWKKDDTETT